MATMQRLWDIFCRVIDNYGDIGVCWRLARQLSTEHGCAVRLWVDDLHSLSPICPACDPQQTRQRLQGIDVRQWTEQTCPESTAQVVIEAFACELPSAYITAMAQATPRPAWINLEYLSTEEWAENCHGLASPHPRLPLTKHFFFPGFSIKTGGLLRENNLPLAPPWPNEGIPEISLFCYEDAPLEQLLESTRRHPEPLSFRVPPGKPRQAVERCLAGPGPWTLGRSHIQPQVFLSQDAYDTLLRNCAVNFVRGEDSFVRAQWAGRPFIWQIYRQADNAHLDKLDAFLNRYLAAWPKDLATLLRDIHHAWNEQGDFATLWPVFLERRPEIETWTRRWTDELRAQPDLCTQLVKFCNDKV